MWGQGLKWRSKIKSQFHCFGHNFIVTEDILMKHCTHMYHSFAVCHLKHMGSVWRTVAYSNKVTVTLFFIHSITYDSVMRYIIMFLCNNSLSDFSSSISGAQGHTCLGHILVIKALTTSPLQTCMVYSTSR